MGKMILHLEEFLENYTRSKDKDKIIFNRKY